MKKIDMHPPVDQRCQIYFQLPGGRPGDLVRCVNDGTHWLKWGGCGCEPDDPDLCEGTYYSWECDDHAIDTNMSEAA
jgi:hypothetical protein